MSKKKKIQGPARVYTLEVGFLSGPLLDEFVEKNPIVTRTLEIRGDQTLDDLNWCIFDAFDREEEHMFEFQFGKKPHDRNNRCYVMPESLDGGILAGLGFGPRPAGLVNETRMDDLALAVGTIFFYWFDFGDDWWHAIRVKAISEPQFTEGKYPRVVARVGESPPQYPFAEELEFVGEDEDEDEEADMGDEP